MKKLLVLAALALVAGVQLNANRVVVDEMTTGQISTSQKECGRTEGPFYKGRCQEEHKIVCPACPDVQCPTCPVCPKVTCEAKVVETCPVAACAVEVKTCHHCGKPWKHCGGCQHLNRHHGRNVEVIEKEVIVERPAAAAAVVGARAAGVRPVARRAAIVR